MSGTPERVVFNTPATEADAGLSPERMPLVVTGHVDHGKSTLVGRLLADTGSLPDGKLEAVRRTCARQGKRFEHAFLLDALKDEQAQGITIDTARVFFRTARRHYVILDAPGHVEFLKNMVTGACRADAALLVIDAHEGIMENSRRHGFMLSVLGIRQIVIVVNKMDLVGYSERVFDHLAIEYAAFLGRLGVKASRFIPASAGSGDNVVSASERLAWYDGPTVLEAIDAFHSRPPLTAGSFRMPVQGVYKFAKPTNQRRIIAGTVLSGRIRAGDEVVFHPSGKKSRVRTLEAFNRAAPTEASADEAVGFTLTDELYLGRGEIATLAGQPAPQVGSRLKVSLFWLGRNPLTTRKEYVLKLGTGKVRFRVEQIHRVIDGADLSASDTAPEVGRNEVAECTLVLNTPLAFDLIDECPPTGRFVIVDNFDISGGGIILEALPELYASLSRETRALPEPAVLWFTGLSGAGKSTIAQQVVQRLLAAGARVECLDGDVVRTAFPQTGFTRPERDEHIRRVGFLASRLEHHGVFVVCALISPYEASRSYVRGLCRRFVEIHVSTPLAECERRDVKGLYERARRGEIAHFTGLDDAYEEPRAPELRIDTSDMTVTAAADAVLATLYLTDQAGAKMPGSES